MKRLGALSLCALGVASCSTGFIPMQNGNMAELKGSKFKVVSSGIRGEASCTKLLGFIPLSDPGLATRAMDELAKSADAVGKSRALANVAYDEYWSYWILFSVFTAKLRADVVEFSE